MKTQNPKQITRALMQAWDEGMERALDDAARTEDLPEQQLNEVAGMHVESGLRGGPWGATEGTCGSCKASCKCQ